MAGVGLAVGVELAEDSGGCRVSGTCRGSSGVRSKGWVAAGAHYTMAVCAECCLHVSQ